MAKSNYLKNLILDTYLNGSEYLALYQSDPTDNNVGVEVAGGSYTRKVPVWNPAADGKKSNSALIEFTGMPATTVTHWGLHDTDRVPGKNILTNPSFETDLSGWSVTVSGQTTFGRVTDQFFHGVASCRVTTVAINSTTYDNQGISTTQNLVGITAGVPYTFSFYVKGPVGKTIRAHLAHSSGAAINDIVADGTWQRVSVTHTPVDTVLKPFALIRFGQDAVHQVYFDAMQVEQAASATAYEDPSANVGNLLYHGKLASVGGVTLTAGGTFPILPGNLVVSED